MFGAAIEFGRRQRVKHCNETMSGIVREMRVGRVTLHAVHGQAAGHAAAPADLDHVAE